MEIFENQKNCLTLRSVSLCGVRLREVLAYAEFDSTQCQPILNLRIFQFSTPRSVSLRRVRLRAVLYCAESDSAQANQFFANISAKTNF